MPVATNPSRSFRLCGLTGLGAATALALGLAAAVGLSVRLEAGLVALSVATFLVLALATKALSGRENLIYYHHEIAVLAVVALATATAGGPVGGHLDVTALGLGAFLACGRVGCLRAGCCHGQPARRGVRYGAAHVREGFPAALAGVPLLPIQAVEAVAVALIVSAGTAIAVGGAAAGAAALWYVSAYAVLRFTLEHWRGDGARRYLWRFSEAQWTSLALLTAGALAALAGVAPSGPLHVALLVLGAAAVALSLRHAVPLRADEVATALAESARGPAPRVVETASGVRCSTGAGHYTFSGPAEPAALARLVERVRHPGAQIEVRAGTQGTIHLVVEPGPPLPSAQPRRSGVPGVAPWLSHE